MHTKHLPVIAGKRSSTTLAFLLGLALLTNFPLPTLAKKSASPLPVETPGITRVRAQAAQYTQAMNTIASLSTTSIQTRDAAAQTVDSIRKLDSILNGGLPKRLTVIALDNRIFKQAVEQETARLGPKIFYERVIANPQILLNLRGASEIKSAVARQLQTDAATLRTTAISLKRVAQAHRKANHVQDNRTTNIMFVNVGYTLPETHCERDPSASPQGGVGESLIVAALVGAAVLLIGSYAAILSKGHEVPPATEQNPNPVSPVAKCLDDAIARRDRCLNTSDTWGDILCAAVYLADRADCLLLPQA